MSQNHYQVLGVSTTATREQIKRAYKALALRYHPDRHQGDTRYEELFKQISIAHGVLTDPARRAAYDQQLRREAQVLAQARQQQQFRHQHQHIYGAPPPTTGPLRTRRPPSSAERHYRPIPRQARRFTRRDYILTAVLGALFLLFLLSVKVAMDRITAQSHYRKGLVNFAEGNWENAHDEFLEALVFDPEMARAHLKRGEIAQLADQDYRFALAAYREAAQHASADSGLLARAWWRMGQCYWALGLAADAGPAFEQALRLNPQLPGAWLGRGALRSVVQRTYPAAIRDLTQGLQLAAQQHQPVPPRFRLYRGLAAYRLGHYQAARADWEEVQWQQPRNGQVLFWLACLAEAEGKPTPACRLFAQAAQRGYAPAALKARLCQGN